MTNELEKEIFDLVSQVRTATSPISRVAKIYKIIKLVERERKAAYKEGHDEALELGYVRGILKTNEVKLNEP